MEAYEAKLMSQDGSKIYYPHTVSDLVYDNKTGKTVKEQIDELGSKVNESAAIIRQELSPIMEYGNELRSDYYVGFITTSGTHNPNASFHFCYAKVNAGDSIKYEGRNNQGYGIGIIESLPSDLSGSFTLTHIYPQSETKEIVVEQSGYFFVSGTAGDSLSIKKKDKIKDLGEIAKESVKPSLDEIKTIIDGTSVTTSVTESVNPSANKNTSTYALAKPFPQVFKGECELTIDAHGLIDDQTNIGIYVFDVNEVRITTERISDYTWKINSEDGVSKIGFYISKAHILSSGTLNVTLSKNTSGLRDEIIKLNDVVEETQEQIEDVKTEMSSFAPSTYNESIPATFNSSGGINTTTTALAYQTDISKGSVLTIDLSLLATKNITKESLSIGLKNEDFVEVKGTRRYEGENLIVEVAENVKFITFYRKTGTSIPQPYALTFPMSVHTKGIAENLKELDSSVQDLKAYNTNLHRLTSKNCLYIGDSISTGGYFWEAYLQEYWKLNKVQYISGELHAAAGGINIVPNSDDETRVDIIDSEGRTQAKSIWFRCAYGNMKAYGCDVISIFGGTNDLPNDSTQANFDKIGTENDIPFVDTLEGFPASKAATLQVRSGDIPSDLTIASALMGCIEMIHRDFPNAIIALCTVMNNGGRGNQKDAQGVSFAERLAMLQMKIAHRYSNTTLQGGGEGCNYGVVAVPFFWDWRTSVSCATHVFSKDGVHPNNAQAKRMARLFAESLYI